MKFNVLRILWFIIIFMIVNNIINKISVETMNVTAFIVHQDIHINVNEMVIKNEQNLQCNKI